MSTGWAFKLIHFLITMVWFINGFFCKVLNLVPRHEEIVGEILGHSNAHLFTFLIGLSEVFIGIWILSGYKRKFVAILQMAIVGVMNVIEFIVVPELLLWGRWNALFAFLFMMVVYCNEFLVNPNSTQRPE